MCGTHSNAPIYLIDNLTRAAADLPASGLQPFAALLSACCSAFQKAYPDAVFLRATLATLPVHKLQCLAQRIQTRGPDGIDIDDPMVYITPERSQAMDRAIEQLQMGSQAHDVPALLNGPIQKLKEMLADLSDALFEPSIDVLVALQQKCRGYLNLPMALKYWEGHSAANLRIARDYIAGTDFVLHADFRDICHQADQALRSVD